MQSGADATRADAATPWTSIAVVAVLIAAGFALTIWVFYPGVMTYDARYVYESAKSGQYGDWQSPAMSVLWGLIDPLDPGPGSIFLLTAALYWLAFAILALTMVRRSAWRAIALPLLALSPPAFIFVGMIWRDMLFAAVWLGAAALTLAVADRSPRVRVPVQVVAVGLLALGVLLRPNAIAAAPILAMFLLWPRQFSWKRAAIVFVPAAVAFFVVMQVVYYGMLGTKRQNPLQSIMVFDLGGITHFSKQNQFPGSWSPAETAMLTERCYQPTVWDIYWTREPCLFVMQRLEGAKIFGSPEIVAAWRRAVAAHPLGYLQHRAAFMWNFLAGANLTIWTYDLADTTKTIFTDKPGFMAVKAVNDRLAATPLLRVGPWLLLCALITWAGWRRRDTTAGTFAIGVGGSAVIYVATFAALGVASDFRYAYWAVLAGLAGAVVIWPANWASRRQAQGAHPPS